jgi:hypothetical protein
MSGEEDGSGIRLGIWAIIAQANGESDRPCRVKVYPYPGVAGREEAGKERSVPAHLLLHRGIGVLY